MSDGNTNDSVYIQKLFTSRDNFTQGNVQEATANTLVYVGNVGRIWWNPVPNAFYYSDGNTPGGILITGGASGNGTVGGANTYVQYNNAGNFAGDPNFTFNSSTSTLTITNIVANTITGGAGGSNTQVLFNDSGNIGGNSQFTFNKASNVLTLTGTANLGNLSIQDQTIYGVVANRNITFDPAGNGAVDVNGLFHVHSGNLTADPIFQVDIDGRVKTLVPNTSSYNGAFNIVGSTNGAEVNPQNYGVMLHITGQPTIPSRIYNDGVANYAAVINRRYNGTSSAPTGVLQNQIIGRLGSTPYLVDDTWPSISTTRLDMVALEDQSTTAQGSAIRLYTVPTGNVNPTTTAEFITDQITMYGNVNPAVSNVYSLGNSTYQWKSLYLGNTGLFLQDVSTGTLAQIQVNNNILTLGNINRVQVGNIQLTNTGLLSTVSTQDIVIGTVGDTGNTVIRNAGVKFTDGSVQTTAAIPLAQKGNALGVVPLNSSTKIDPIYLPSGAITFKGVWNAANNTPTLADGVGTNGDEYIVGVAGTQNLGSGAITFAVGDFVLYTASNVWVDIPVGTPGVTAFNSRTGNVTLQSGDVTNALTAGSITNSYLANAGISINYSGGLSGNASVNLGGTLSLTNTGVTGIAAGTGVTVTGATGNVTVSIGQPVGTANSVTFQAITSNTTVAATSNITGGNLTTGGQIVATGNIQSSGNVSGSNFLTGGLVSAVANVTGGNLVGQNLTAGRVAIVGSGKQVADDADFTYNSTTNVLSVVGNVNASYFNGNVVGTGNLSTTGNVIGAYGVFSNGNTVINDGVSTTGNVTGNYFIGNGRQLTGVLTTITPNALSSTVHVAAVTTGNVANIITDATTANTANTIVLRDQYGAINVNAWAVNTKLTATSYTATTTDYWIGCTTKGLTITLPNAANGAYNGRQYQIGDTVHSGNPGDTITAQSPATVSGNDALTQQGQIVLATYINGNWYLN